MNRFKQLINRHLVSYHSQLASYNLICHNPTLLMNLQPTLISLALLPTIHAATISWDDTDAFSDPAPTEILNEHRKKQHRGYSIGIPGVTETKAVRSDIWDWSKKDSQAYDWFQASNLRSPELESNLESLGTPVPEPSGSILFGLATLALTLRRKR